MLLEETNVNKVWFHVLNDFWELFHGWEVHMVEVSACDHSLEPTGTQNKVNLSVVMCVRQWLWTKDFFHCRTRLWLSVRPWKKEGLPDLGYERTRYESISNATQVGLTALLTTHTVLAKLLRGEKMKKFCRRERRNIIRERPQVRFASPPCLDERLTLSYLRAKIQSDTGNENA